MLRLRSGPQDLPAGFGLALLLSVAWLAQGLVTDQLLDDTGSAPRSLLAVLVQFGAVIALLSLRDRAARIPQTISALAGTGFIFGLFGSCCYGSIRNSRSPDSLSPTSACLSGAWWSTAIYTGTHCRLK